MSQKKRKRERIPALSGSIETPPTMSFQLELKLQHYIIPKTSLWLIIPWEPGTHASHGVTDVASGANSPFWVHQCWGQVKGHPWMPSNPFLLLRSGTTDRWPNPFHFQLLGRCPQHPILSSPPLCPTGPLQSHPRCSNSSWMEELGFAGAGRTGVGGKMLLILQNRST